jgi:hypothetical protein
MANMASWEIPFDWKFPAGKIIDNSIVDFPASYV